jgi:outer membrane protein assembly factor BamB
MPRVPRSLAIWLGLLTVVSLVPTSVVALKEKDHEHVPQVSPTWNVRFKDMVLWQRVTSLGALVIGTESGVHGVNPGNGQIVWSHTRFGELDKDRFEEIDGTPYVVLAGGQTGAGGIILDSVDGRVVLDSRRVGVTRVLGKHVLPRSRTLMVLAVRDGSTARSMLQFDLATGQSLWVHDKLLGNAADTPDDDDQVGAAQSSVSQAGLTAEPIEVSDEAFLVATERGVYNLDARTGKVGWKVRSPGKVLETRFFRRPAQDDVIFVGMEAVSKVQGAAEDVHAFYGAFRLTDGRSVWNGLVRVGGRLNDVAFHAKGLIVTSRTDGTGRVKLVDYATGKSLWRDGGRGIELPLGVIEVGVTDAGVVLTMAERSTEAKKGEEHLLNLLDVEAGSLRLEKPVKVMGRLLSAEVLDGGILYLTDSELNILNPQTGAPAFKKPVRSEHSLITMTTDDGLYAYSRDEGALYRLDRESGSLHKLSRKRVKLEGDELPTSLEVEDDRIVIVSSQNIVAFDSDGSLRYHAHHPAPEQVAWMAPLQRAQAVRAGMQAAGVDRAEGDSVLAASNRRAGSPGGAVAAAVARRYRETVGGRPGGARKYAETVRARVDASRAPREHVYTMVQLSDEYYGLVKINKKTGKMLKMIRLGKKKRAIYAVDSIWDQVYYRPNPFEVVGYKF